MERTRFRSPRTRITNTSHECPAYPSLTPETAWRKSQLSSVQVFLMATTSKKGADKTKVKARNRSLKKSQPKHPDATKELRRERDEALEQLAAASDILRMIARSPTDLQPVLDAIAESAAKLCDAADAVLWRVDGDVFRLASHFGSIPTRVGRGQGHAITRDMPASRAMVDRETIHIHDLAAAEADFPEAKTAGIAMGVRTTLVAPLLREGKAIGSIHIRRREVRPFTERQIKLLETFADQAVIAIENVRLFQGLTEALEQQTATSEILRVIASSPTDIQQVLDTVAENAARLCGANDALIRRIDGDVLPLVAQYGHIPGLTEADKMPLQRGSVLARSVIDRQTIHIHDLAAESEDEFPVGVALARRFGYRTVLATPLLREGIPLGAIIIRRLEVRPFSDKQVALLQTFADQAVIAIENARLFQELNDKSTKLETSNVQLTEALEQQTATSEILRVIASSPTDLQPVLNTIAENATRLCDAKDVSIGLVEGDVLQVVASYGMMARWWPDEGVPINRGSVTGRTIVDRQPIHVHDLASESDEEFPLGKIYQKRGGHRTNLGIPLLREGVPIGVIAIRRMEVRPFSDKQIALLKTFADQAVIAIENVRLFKELEARNRDLTEALEQQTATGEVLRVIASSPTELQPVLDTLIANAVKLSGATKGHVRQVDGEFYRVVAHYGESPERIGFLRANPLPASADTPIGRALVERRPVHILDVQLLPEPLASLARQTGARTVLATPLLREGTPIGGIIIWRDFVEPFTERQIELVKTFADQAVIAIENVRLFQELTEALEQQTATSEILGVIASSPTDIQPVLDTVAENAARVCDAIDAQIISVEGDFVRPVASYGPMPARGREERARITPTQAPTLAIINRQTIHVHDMAAEVETKFPQSKLAQQRFGTRTLLCAPLLREGVPLGAILIRRTEVRPFSDKQIKLLETFASQAVIAIENVRLFKELQARNAELREALEHQTATAEVLGIISRSPTDVQPVLDAIVESAARVCGIDDVLLRLREDNVMVSRAHFGPMPIDRPRSAIDEPQNMRWMRRAWRSPHSRCSRAERFPDC